MGAFRDFIQQQGLVVFDIDGTLVDTFQKNHFGTNIFLQSLGLNPVDEQWTRDFVYSSTVQNILREIERQFGVTFEDYDQAGKSYEAALVSVGHLAQIQVGVEGIVNELMSNGQKIGLVTSATRAEQEPTLALLAREIGSLFWSSYVCVDDVYPDVKPHPRSMGLIFQQMGRLITPYVVIGDGNGDIQLPRNTSPRGNSIFLGKESLIKGEKPDHIFKDMSHLYRAYRE
ncbi:HAD family hydrolase [Candidatus Woesearchaeota archaeon]|nr:HAD family hydrolase [Candidatus Woesearchaeota archaeon]